jgi:hypothetical protein
VRWRLESTREEGSEHVCGGWAGQKDFFFKREVIADDPNPLYDHLELIAVRSDIHALEVVTRHMAPPFADRELYHMQPSLPRRRVLQALVIGPLLALTRPQQAEAQAPTAPIYTDSENNDSATLASLHDGDRQSGGVAYQA